jgi:hypothetical protein
MAAKEHRMPKWAPVVLALALASAASLEAAEVGSTELVRQCKYPRQGKRTIDENADALQCLSYIDGFVAGASINRDTSPCNARSARRFLARNRRLRKPASCRGARMRRRFEA